MIDPPDNVIDIGTAKPNRESNDKTISYSIWMCECDCITFRLHGDGAVVYAKTDRAGAFNTVDKQRIDIFNDSGQGLMMDAAYQIDRICRRSQHWLSTQTKI